MRSGSTSAQAVAGRLDQFRHPRDVERALDAVVEDVDTDDVGLADLLFVRAFLRALFTIQDIGARDFVLASAHQREFDLILDFLDMNRAAIGLALHQRGDDDVGELRRQFAHACRCGALASVDREERLGDRDGDLGGLEADYRAVAANDFVLR